MPLEVTGRYEKIWKPHAKQEEFIQIPFEVFEALYGGAVGGGKSELLYMLPIVYGFHEHPRFHGVLFRETFPQLEASLILRAIPIYKMLGARYNEQSHVATFPSGARIKFSYIQNMKDAREHDTNEYQYQGWDELTAQEWESYQFLTSRVRSVIDGVPPIIRGATNPGNVGHLWVRRRFIEPFPSGGRTVYDRATETYRIFIRALLTDNPHLLDKDPGYIKRLNILSEADRRAKIYGDWWTFSGQVFTEWRDPFFGTPFPDEPPNACHVVDDFDPPLYLPRIIACDWGYSPGRTWVGWAAVGADKRAILYRERVWDKTDISVWGAEVSRISQPERNSIVSFKLDPSAWGKRGEARTLADQIIEATGMPFDKADNDRLGGKLLMHEMLRWRPKPASFIPEAQYDEERAYRILRNFGPDAYKQYVDITSPEAAEDNLPRFRVCKSCVEFRKTIPACVYDTKDGKQVEDVAEFTGDDPYDGGRYLIKAIDDYTRLAQSETRKHEALAEIVQEFDRTKDWNTYHRRMALYDKEFRKESKSIPRKRRSRRYLTVN